MKRKVILMGGRTHVISLPATWISQHNVKKGQEIELTDNDGKITITTSTTPEIKYITIESKNIQDKIEDLYQLGYDEIRINGKIDTEELQQLLCNNLPGFEIISSTDRHSLIKSISEPDKKELNNMIKRAMLLLNSGKNGKRLINACKRIISRGEVKNLKKSILLYKFLSRLDSTNKEELEASYNLFQKLEAGKINYQDTHPTNPTHHEILMMAIA